MLIRELLLLRGKVALVTGAGKGIGRAIAQHFARAGATVYMLARTETDLQQAITESLDAIAAEANGGQLLAVVGDSTDSLTHERIVQQLEREHGRLDILVNNVGGFPPGSLEKLSPENFRQAISFNTGSAFDLTRATLGLLRNSQQASVINIASLAGRLIQPQFVAYGTAKAAMIQMSRLMAAELAPQIRVNTISPGPIMTDALQKWYDEAAREQLRLSTPLQALGQVEDIAHAALFLAADASRWVSGKDLQIDGGAENATF